MVLFGVSMKSLQEIKFFETFEDGDLEEYRSLLSQEFFSGREEDLLQLTDNNGRSPLHMVCMKGYAKFAEYLIRKYVEYGFSLNPLDKRKDSPLLLVSSHGHDNEELETEEAYDRFLENRFAIIEMLVENDPDIFEYVPRHKNNPLHWAIYYGDVSSGIYLFKKCPKMLLLKNENGRTPLEIIFQNSIKKNIRKRSQQLVKCIVEEFLHACFVQDDNIMEPEVKKVLREFDKLKNKDNIYDTDRLVNRLFVLESDDVENIKSAINPVLNILKQKADKLKDKLMKFPRKSMPTKIKNLPIENEDSNAENSDKDILKDRSFNLSHFMKKDAQDSNMENSKLDEKDYNVIKVEQSGKKKTSKTNIRKRN